RRQRRAGLRLPQRHRQAPPVRLRRRRAPARLLVLAGLAQRQRGARRPRGGGRRRAPRDRGRHRAPLRRREAGCVRALQRPALAGARAGGRGEGGASRGRAVARRGGGDPAPRGDAMRAAVALALLLLGSSAWAQAPVFTQAIVIGANNSVDRELAPLRYADDDAIRFAELFDAIGIPTRVLTRLDEPTSRLHPGAAARALVPTDAQLRAVVAEVAALMAQARARGQKTALYLVFAGHGNARR